MTLTLTQFEDLIEQAQALTKLYSHYHLGYSIMELLRSKYPALYKKYSGSEHDCSKEKDFNRISGLLQEIADGVTLKYFYQTPFYVSLI